MKLLLDGHFTGCKINELWNLPAPGAIILPNVSSLDAAAQYPSCDDESVGSAVLENTALNTATVAYYNGTTAGSRACFVCDNGYEPSTNTNERFCKESGLWSGNSIVCGTLSTYHLITIIML